MAGNRIFKIVFTGDSSGVGSATNQMEGHFSKFGAAVSGAFFGIGQMVGQELLQWGEKVTKFAFDSSDKFVTMGLNIGKLQRITGGTAEEMSALRMAADNSGISFEKLSVALVRFSRALGNGAVPDATEDMQDMAKAQEDLEDSQLRLVDMQDQYQQRLASGPSKGESYQHWQLNLAKIQREIAKEQGDMNLQTGKSAEIMEKNGIQIRDANGKYLSTYEILSKVSDRFKSMPDGMEKTALAVQLFGRSGADLLPMLNKGSAGLADASAEAKKLGLAFSEADVAQAKTAKEVERNRTQAWEGFQVTIGKAVTPAIEAFNKQIGEELPKWTKKASDFLSSPEFKDGMTKVMDWLKENVPKIAQSISDFVTGLGKWWGDHGQSIVDGFERFGDGVSQVGTAFGELSKALDPVFGTLQKLTELPGISQVFGLLSGSKIREGFGDLTDVASGKKKVDGFFAQGGMVPATPGGMNVVVGEGGEDEWIIPQSKMGALVGGGGGGIVVNVHTLNANSETGRIIAESLRDYRNAGGTVKVA